MKRIILYILLMVACASIFAQHKWPVSITNSPTNSYQKPFDAPFQCPVRVGAERLHKYLPLLKGKRVAIMANQTSMIGDTHLVDFFM